MRFSYSYYCFPYFFNSIHNLFQIFQVFMKKFNVGLEYARGIYNKLLIMKSRVDKTRYPKTAENSKMRENNKIYTQNDRNIVRKNISSSLVGKSQSKKTIMGTLDLDDVARYRFDAQEVNYKQKRMPSRNMEQRNLNLKKIGSEKFRIPNRESILSIAAMLPDNCSSRSQKVLEKVIEDLSHHNSDIMNEAKSTVKDFQQYIEELLTLNTEMEDRLIEYEKAYQQLEEQNIKLQEELINASEMSRNQMQQSTQISQKKTNQMVKKTLQLAEKQKKHNATINRLQKEKDQKMIQLSSKEEQIKLLEECLEGKETVIKKMSGFNNQLCLELMELKNSQRNYLESNETESQIEYKLSKKEKQICSLKQVNGLLRKQIFQFMKENENVLINLLGNLQREREKNGLLEEQLVKEMESKKKTIEQFDYQSLGRSKSGKILKQKALTPKSTFESFVKTCQNVDKSSEKDQKARIVTNPQKYIEEYLLNNMTSPKQFLRIINKAIRLFCKKILENEEKCQIQPEVKNIEESLMLLLRNKKQSRGKIAELNFPSFSQQDLQIITHDKKDSIERIQKRNEFIIDRINNFRTALEEVQKIEPFSPISIKNEKYRRKDRQVSYAEDSEYKIEQSSNNYDSKILKKFGNFDAYADYTFEPNS